jgi:hypothetical protein
MTEDILYNNLDESRDKVNNNTKFKLLKIII